MPRYWLKPAAFMLCCLPLAFFILDAFSGALAHRPAKYITNYTGDVALRFLVLTLAVTPIRLITLSNEVARLRRMLGLFAFGYTVLHGVAYFVRDLHSDPSLIVRDLNRVFIIAGWLAVLIFVALAATSTNAMVGRLGGQNWRRLHRLTYLAAGLGVLHTYFIDDSRHHVAAVAYGLIFLALLGVRVAYRASLKRSTQQ